MTPSPKKAARSNVREPTKREAILEAATRVFLSRGYEGTSMELVAQESGAGRRTVYNQFATKKALFDATVEKVWERMPIDRIVAETSVLRDPETALLQIGHAISEFWAPAEAIAFVRMVIAESVRFPDLAQSFFDAGKEPALQAVIDYFRALNKAGVLNIKDPDLAARQFVGLVNEPLLWFRVIGIGRAPSKERRKHVVEEAVVTFLCRHKPQSKRISLPLRRQNGG